MVYQNLRKYGNPPFHVCLVHGGPGAVGEMAPVARELSSKFGVLEPLQTAESVHGQVEELRDVLKAKGDPPMILIGFSWGAWLSYLLAAHHPKLVRKLIFVSSGPFEEMYTKNIHRTRMSRLSEKERLEVESLMRKIEDPETDDKNELFERFGRLISKADVYDPITIESEDIRFDLDQFQKVWPEAEKLRQSGELLKLGKQIRCPVVAIHGDYDPHPAKGVQEPLSRILKDFRFVLLQKCGHKSWIERQAKERFLHVLEKEINIG